MGLAAWPAIVDGRWVVRCATPLRLGARQEVRLCDSFACYRHDPGDHLLLLRYLDFLTRRDPAQNLSPPLRHLLKTGRFHEARMA
jgi:hypothetical protein